MSEAFLHDALVLRNGAMAVSLVAETSAFTMESDLFSIFTSITFSPWRPARPVMLLMGHAIYARSVPIVTPWLIEMTHLSQFPKSRNLSRKRNGPSIYKAINEDSITGWAVLTTPLAASKSMWTLPSAPWVLKMSVHSGVELEIAESLGAPPFPAAACGSKSMDVRAAAEVGGAPRRWLSRKRQ